MPYGECSLDNVFTLYNTMYILYGKYYFLHLAILSCNMHESISQISILSSFILLTFSARFNSTISSRGAIHGLSFLSLFIYKYLSDVAFTMVSCRRTEKADYYEKFVSFRIIFGIVYVESDNVCYKTITLLSIHKPLSYSCCTLSWPSSIVMWCLIIYISKKC